MNAPRDRCFARASVLVLFGGVLVCCTGASPGHPSTGSPSGLSPTLAQTAREPSSGSLPRASDPAPAPAPSAHYEIGPMPALHEAVRWPAPPRISREEDVHARVHRHVVRQPGTRIVLTGSVDELVVAADDVEIRAAPEARVGQLTIERGVKRVRIAGGHYGFIELPVPAQFVPAPPVWSSDWLAEDVTIDGVTIEAEHSAFFVRGRRVAILNSRARAQHYSIWCGDTRDASSEDLIIAGNRFESAGQESTVRLVDVRRAVVVDNVLSNSFKHDFRVHGRSDHIVFARNRLINTGIMIGTMQEDHIGSVWILDNELHHRVPSLFEASTERVRFLAAHGNRVFSDQWACFVCNVAMSRGWDVSDNPVAPYRAAPASWSE